MSTMDVQCYEHNGRMLHIYAAGAGRCVCGQSGPPNYPASTASPSPATPAVPRMGICVCGHAVTEHGQYDSQCVMPGCPCRRSRADVMAAKGAPAQPPPSTQHAVVRTKLREWIAEDTAAQPPPSSEGQTLERYGIGWTGPQSPTSYRMADGYWTPWHIAEATVSAQARQIEELTAELDAAWKGIENGYDIESRAELEQQAKTNGFKYGLAQAVHTIWKREPKVQSFQQQLSTVRAALQKWANRADHGFDPEESDASVDFWRGVRRVTEEALAAVPEEPSET